VLFPRSVRRLLDLAPLRRPNARKTLTGKDFFGSANGNRTFSHSETGKTEVTDEHKSGPVGLPPCSISPVSSITRHPTVTQRATGAARESDGLRVGLAAINFADAALSAAPIGALHSLALRVRTGRVIVLNHNANDATGRRLVGVRNQGQHKIRLGPLASDIP
jgi:hypothetical protein